MQRAMKHMLGMGVFAVATGGQSLAADLYPAPHPAVAYVAAAASPTGPDSILAATLESAGAMAAFPTPPVTPSPKIMIQIF